MERDSKRKANGQPLPFDDTPRSLKRTRLPGDIDISEETPYTTTESGIRFLESLRNAKDKTGRPIATEFLHLPNRNTPGYYEVTKLPIALDTLERKLLNHEYYNLSQLESDLKRLVANAKSFNEKGSDLYEDAERVRKTASNWMTRHNPAYRDKNYVAVATPVPEDGQLAQYDLPMPSPYAVTLARGGAERPTRGAGRKSTSAIPPVAAPEPEATEEDIPAQYSASHYKGLSFQEAQDTIVQELLDYEEDNLLIFSPFATLPSRTLTDYYQVIKHPVSLKSVQKLVRGIHGRAPSTGVSDFQSWDAFGAEVAHIWDNCRTYNEDGSDMYNLAGDLERIFKEKLEEVRNVVPQPQQQKLKLKLGKPSGIKLKFGGARDSPASTPGPSTPGVETAPPGIVVNNEALSRQQEHVNAGVNGARNGLPMTVSHATSGASVQTSRSASAASPPAQSNGVKNEGSLPPPAAYGSQGNGLRMTSDSPFPQAPTQPVYHPPVSHHGPPGLKISRQRPADQDPSDYLIQSVHISSHPSLALSQPFSIRIPASKKLIHQSVTFNVPPTHYHLQIVPNIPVAATGRAYRFFVVINGSKSSEITKPGVERDRSKPVFEARLERGAVHRIEVEVLAEKAGGVDTKADVQWEKTTCLIHIPRS